MGNAVHVKHKCTCDEIQEKNTRMQLSSQETRSVLIMGVGGLCVASAFQLLSVYINQACDNVTLDPETELLQSHPLLLSLFVQLGHHRSLNETAYRKAVISADSLLVRANQILTKEVRPNMDDIRDGFSLYKDVIKQLTKLHMSARKAKQQRAAAEIHNLTEKVFPEVQKTYTQIHKSVNY